MEPETQDEIGTISGLKLQTKLMLSFTFVSILIGIAGGTGLFFAKDIANSAKVFSDIAAPIANHSTALGTEAKQIHNLLGTALQTSDDGSKVEVVESLNVMEANLGDHTAMLRDLAAKGNLELDLDGLAAAQKAYSNLARAALDEHSALLAAKGTEAQLIADSKIKSKAIRSALIEFARSGEQSMSELQESITTLIKGQVFMNFRFEGILDNTYNKAYPQVLGGYRIVAYLGDLDNAILALTNATNIQNIQQIEKEFQADAVELRSWLERTRERAGDRIAELDAISAQFDAYADLVTAKDGLFALHRANIGARIQKAGTNAALDQAIRNFENALVNISAAANDINTRVRSETVATIRNAITAIIAVIAVGILAGCGFGYLLSRAISLPLSRMTNVTGRLAAGDMAVVIPGGNRGDEIGDMARSLEQIRSVGVRAAQAQSSLDDASSPMMIVDLSGHVLFPNKAMNRLFDNLSDSLARHLDGFGEQSLAGAEFDTLHNLDAMKSEILTTTDEPVSRRMIAGDLTLDLTASPVFNDSGNRLGTVVEWQDMTGQVAVEREIAGIVDAATEGNFSQRLTETGKSGFFADLAGGMNKLLEVVDTGLDQVVKVVSALAEGDLSRRMQGEHKGAFARLKQDADRMGDQMEEIVGRITEVSSSVQTATDEISSGISDLSSRTEHQASSLEETTASMEELSATVRQNADNAQEANQMATEARKVATTGGDVVQRSVVAMSGIEASSRKITEIVGLIQEIAFQTNLLALNASVEAARAGEAGRGFAVVANEVRALAQRAASASKDIKELIVNSDGQVKEGVQLVGEAGQALEEIVDSVKKVADYVSEIAAASHEQTTGIEQVSGAITGMDEMTQQNASLVEETNGAILSAVGQVSELRRAVGFFKTAQSANIDLGDTEDDEDSAQPEGNALQQPRPIAKPSRSLSAGSGALAQKVDVDWNEF